MGTWWGKLVASSKVDVAHQKTADDPAECASQYRLESLEPRLLLSADPISAELARIVQQDAEENAADSVAAIIQEIDTIAETQGADSSGKGHEGLKVNWPETWVNSNSVITSQFNLFLVVADLLNQARQSLDLGVDSSELVIEIKAGDQATSATTNDADS